MHKSLSVSYIFSSLFLSPNSHRCLMQIKKHFLILFSSCLPGNTSKKNIRLSNDPNQSRTQTEKASCDSGRENGKWNASEKKRREKKKHTWSKRRISFKGELLHFNECERGNPDSRVTRSADLPQTVIGQDCLFEFMPSDYIQPIFFFFPFTKFVYHLVNTDSLLKT